ncbi:Hypothetical predicted protein [Mytilus galloprovincialis]|uniref:Uncharacterized protein n=1 Tax=Mytilus galloprovincialis TaxID=29158 RepID=A0A8B6G224_MYTGA|nr:Hypothetical predicted protein [Mytilus galloprovincialis]
MRLMYCFVVFCVFGISASKYIQFQKDYEYWYKYNSNSTIHDLGNFRTVAEISFTTINVTEEVQEILLKVNSFFVVSEAHKEQGAGSAHLDFTNWFSFEIKLSGEILSVFHDTDEHHDVLIAKKGFASLFSSKLQNSNSEVASEWAYQTTEHGNEGHHNASYAVIKTATGIQFKKIRHSTPIPNAKGVHQKVLHFDHDLGTIKRVVVEEEFTSPQIAPDFDSEKGMRKVKAVNDFSTMENPTIKATNKGELQFWKKEKIKEKSYRPKDDIVIDSIHIGNYQRKEHNAQKLDKLKGTIKSNLICIRTEPEKGLYEHITIAITEMVVYL